MFCTAYLNNVLIYSKSKKKHTNHMLQVLKHLHKQELQVDINKYKFFTIKVKYLGMIVKTNRIEIDGKKIDVI